MSAGGDDAELAWQRAHDGSSGCATWPRSPESCGPRRGCGARPYALATPAEYAQVVKMLGNGRLEAQCFDGEKRLAHIRGKLRKKVSVVEEMAGEDRGVGGGQTWAGGGDAGH